MSLLPTAIFKSVMTNLTLEKNKSKHKQKNNRMDNAKKLITKLENNKNSKIILPDYKLQQR